MIQIQTSELVYSPREDSYLFVDNSERLIRSNPQSVIEIGVGTGFIILNLVSKLQHSSSKFAVDINPHAAYLTLVNSKLNNIDDLHIIISDGLSCFRKTVFELVLFNPPYLPEDEFSNKLSKLENLQYIGGPKGFETLSSMIMRFKDRFKEINSILSSLSASIEEFQNLHHEFTIKTIAEKKMGFETLWLISIKGETSE